MKKVFALALVAVMAIAGAVKADAQLRFGLKAGVCVNDLKFDEKIMDSDNRAGFTGGVMAELTVPVIGLGADASVMYVRRSAKWMTANVLEGSTTTSLTSGDAPLDYINIPINLKWKIGIPVVGKLVTPFVTTGPDFAFLCGKRTFDDVVKGQNFDFSWNFGVGVELMSHLQIHASYGLGLTKALKYTKLVGIEGPANPDGAGIEGKNRYWTVTAAYLF